jgi:cyclophilin family peptidyl-prolyl cis-trans isomerase
MRYIDKLNNFIKLCNDFRYDNNTINRILNSLLIGQMGTLKIIKFRIDLSGTTFLNHRTSMINVLQDSFVKKLTLWRTLSV